MFKKLITSLVLNLCFEQVQKEECPRNVQFEQSYKFQGSFCLLQHLASTVYVDQKVLTILSDSFFFVFESPLYFYQVSLKSLGALCLDVLFVNSLILTSCYHSFTSTHYHTVLYLSSIYNLRYNRVINPSKKELITHSILNLIIFLSLSYLREFLISQHY